MTQDKIDERRQLHALAINIAKKIVLARRDLATLDEHIDVDEHRRALIAVRSAIAEFDRSCDHHYPSGELAFVGLGQGTEGECEFCRTKFFSARTVTGRFPSKPNLQQLPRIEAETYD